MRAGLKVILVVATGVLLAVSGIAQEREIVINEVAWGGASENPTAEWIELFNATERKISLEGWRLVSSDGSPEIFLQGTISPFSADPAEPGGFYLLERNDDKAVPDVEADLIYAGALNDGGETLRLLDPAGRTVDTANLGGGRWPAGTNRLGTPPCDTMERIDPAGPDVLKNWATYLPSIGEEARNEIRGTPRAENSVFNLPPHVEFSITPSPAHPHKPVHFDASASADPNGEVVAFAWDFGDGTTGEGQTTSHTYAAVGTYTLSLTVKDNKGGVSQLKQEVRVIINVPPLADFSVKPAPSKRVLQSLDELAFSDESHDPDGEVVAWAWDFGDGVASEGQTTSHTYQRGGNYTVTLIVTDDQGELALQTQSLRIIGRHPVARFTFTPQIPNEGKEVTLNASGSFDLDGTIVRYEWDFDGDGEVELITDQPTTTHAFPEGGDNEIILRVIDDEGDVSLPLSGTIHVNWTPVASFQISNFLPAELEEVTFTDRSADRDPDGKITAWRWDFGDGTYSDIPSPAHAYSADGFYMVTLTVIDDNDAEGNVKAEINVINLPPVAKLLANGEEVEVEVLTGDPVLFDASTSKDQSPQGEIVRYEWDLGADGTYEESTTCPTFTHSYADDGTYKVRLRVTDDDGSTALSNSITVEVDNRPPTSAFDWTPSLPDDAIKVEFADRSTDPDGEVVSWCWDFGDRSTSTTKSPGHQFPDDGIYTVTLVVQDDDGKKTSYSQEIPVGNAPPVAAFTVSSSSPQVGELVWFTNISYDLSPTGEIVHVAWNFGDETTCPGRSSSCGEGDVHAPTHTYKAAGTYTVTLVVIDEEGKLSRATQTITVAE